MQNQKIEEICCLAHRIDPRINLFQGFFPKETEQYKGELLFWRQVVSLYGLFADSDRVLVKEKRNLLNLMKRYDLIEREDYENGLKLWNVISELRKWFCYNNDTSLYYADKREKKISDYLDFTFLIATNKPKKIEDVQARGWEILTFDIESRFETYLEILRKGLSAWKDSDYKSELLDEWIVIYAGSLFADKELIQNVLADIARFEKMNQGIINLSVPQLAMVYYRQLEDSGFSEKNIEKELRNNNSEMTSKEIIMESIRKSQLI